MSRLQEKLDKLADELEAEETEDARVYLHVRVALRLPGGTEVVIDYDAEDAEAGIENLSLKGMTFGTSDVNPEDVARLKRLLGAPAPVLGWEWGLSVRLPDEDKKPQAEPADDESEKPF